MAMVKTIASRFRLGVFSILLALVWMLVCFATAVALLYTGWENSEIAKTTLRSHLLAQSLLSRPAPSKNHFSGYTLWAKQTLPLILEHQSSYKNVAYVLIWKSDGTVVFLAPQRHKAWSLETSFLGHTLDPTHWPTPAGQGLTVRTIRRAPWRTDQRTYIDTQIPLNWPGTRAILSVGYASASFQTGFFRDLQHIIVLLALGVVLAGLILGVSAIWITRRLEKSRAHYARTLLARTSLLSERGMLASVLAHEVRSPLTALRFNLHFMRSLLDEANHDPTRYAELLHSCEREVRRLDLMLDDFLTRTQIVGDARASSLNAVVTEALDFLRPALTHQDIRIITHLDPADPHVSISSDELRQVLLNLCTNAQEAMLRSGTLVVSTVAEPDDAILLVRDSGTGMPPDVQQRLFDPFFTTKPRGSGLGLTLVRRVVTGAGGGVFFESEPQRGTTFRIVLPRALPAAVAGRRTYDDFKDMTSLRSTLGIPVVQSPQSEKGSQDDGKPSPATRPDITGGR